MGVVEGGYSPLITTVDAGADVEVEGIAEDDDDESGEGVSTTVPTVVRYTDQVLGPPHADRLATSPDVSCWT
jgi:hypothetical protein